MDKKKELAKDKPKKKLQMETPAKEETETPLETSAKEERENSPGISENPPDGACQELLDIWASGKGCYDKQSKWCIACENDFPEVMFLCEKRTLLTKEKKASPKRTTTRGAKVGFGHSESSQAGQIDLLLLIGTTKEEILEGLNTGGFNRHNLNDKKLWNRVMIHFRYLKMAKKVVIMKGENGKYVGSLV